MAKIRRLAAIMFTDIVGFTSLMGIDEDNAIKILDKNRKFHRSFVNKYHGEWLNEMGDGILASFSTPTDAVRCACEIQREAINAGIGLRVGIHQGEVIFENSAVLGDGVNVASRLQDLAEEGSINISGAVYNDVKNKTGIEVEYLGEKSFKNVVEPIKVYKATCELSLTEQNRQGYSQAQSQDTRPSVAVLPFVNMSNDPEQEYFCDGITEDILNDLTQLKDIRVVARTSSFAYKDKNQDIRDIGLQLSVDTIVEGSVRKAGNQLRITAQLINVTDGFHLWSDRYDRELEDVFAIQNEISKSIVESLEIELSTKDRHKIEKAKTQNVKAYDYYIKGRSYLHRIHRNTTNYAIQLFTQAIEMDNSYALAYSGLADSYAQYYMYFERNKSTLQKALDLSQKALQLDPDLAESHSSRGVALSQNSEYLEAEQEFDKALQINPNLFVANYQYARASRAQGKLSKAVHLFEAASKTRPDDYESSVFLVAAYDDLNESEKREKEIKRCIKVVKNHLLLNPGDSRALYLGAQVLIRAGEKEEAVNWMGKSLTIDPDEPSVYYNAACLSSLMGNIEDAIKYFEFAIGAGYVSKEWIENDSDLDLIRDHPKFIEISQMLEA
ncbi:tetratricopeptide repeat protein [uncultured Cocleimonas sp.]|uniref:TPR end-of-group domain-containing protein n=1 Tax=uncultured Cocleimonas sp. TaxID=1051587 RepID=UPI0026386D5B|nr:tetratricopeptide repeat protein [uncultured Cocleimonas sp.]